MGSLTSCDPGDVYETVANFKRDGIRTSVIGLAAEVHVCKVLSKETGGMHKAKARYSGSEPREVLTARNGTLLINGSGSYAVALNEGHLKELMLDMVPPLPVTEHMQQLYGSNMMIMGFPSRVEEETTSLCAEYVACIETFISVLPLPFELISRILCVLAVTTCQRKSVTFAHGAGARFAKCPWIARYAA